MSVVERLWLVPVVIILGVILFGVVIGWGLRQNLSKVSVTVGDAPPAVNTECLLC